MLESSSGKAGLCRVEYGLSRSNLPAPGQSLPHTAVTCSSLSRWLTGPLLVHFFLSPIPRPLSLYSIYVYKSSLSVKLEGDSTPIPSAFSDPKSLCHDAVLWNVCLLLSRLLFAQAGLAQLEQAGPVGARLGLPAGRVFPKGMAYPDFGWSF